PVRPALSVIVLDESGALMIDPIYQLYCLVRALAFLAEPSHLVLLCGIDEDVKRVRHVLKKIGRPAADDYAVPLRRDALHNLFRHLDQRVGIDHIQQMLRFKASLETAEEKRFPKAVMQWVSPLFAPRNGRTFTFRQPGYFASQLMIPELPAAGGGHCFSNSRTAAAILSIERNHFNHCCLQP